MSLKTFTKQFELLLKTYMSVVVPKEAGKAQLEETQQAFISGAHALFSTLTGPLADQPEDVCETQMLELDAFFQRYQETRTAQLRARQHGTGS